MQKRLLGKYRSVLVKVFKYGLGLGLLAWVVWQYWQPAGGAPGLADALERGLRGDLRVVPLLVAVTIGLAGLLVNFLRWYLLVRAQDLPMTLTNALRLGLLGFSSSTFLPGSIGGDIVKAAFLARQQHRRTIAVATVVVDRLVGLCGLFWLAALSGGIFWIADRLGATGGAGALDSIVVGAWVLTAASLVFWLLLGMLSDDKARAFAVRLTRLPRIGGSAAELWRGVWIYRCRGRSVFVALLLAMVGHVTFTMLFYFSALTLYSASEIPSPGAHFLLVPVGMTIQAGYPAPGGVGGTEYGFGTLYRLAGCAFASGVLASLVQRAVYWALALVGYVVYLRTRPTLAHVAENPTAELATAEA